MLDKNRVLWKFPTQKKGAWSGLSMQISGKFSKKSEWRQRNASVACTISSDSSRTSCLTERLQRSTSCCQVYGEVWTAGEARKDQEMASEKIAYDCILHEYPDIFTQHHLECIALALRITKLLFIASVHAATSTSLTQQRAPSTTSTRLNCWQSPYLKLQHNYPRLI